MKKVLAVALFSLLLIPGFAFAQATRTWVSGVGDDANPGSRTAPCKTFAGVLSKTAAGGEIDALDPAGFGGVTITKAITIDGGGNLASVLVSGTNGIVINAGDADVVILRNLSLEGLTTGLSAIRILKAGAVHIENCTIKGFQVGIDFASSSPGAQLFVRNCTIRKCSTAGVSLTSGIVKIEQTSVEGCAAGFLLSTGRATLTECNAAGNTGAGFSAAANTTMMLGKCVATGNGIGVNSDGVVFLEDSTITNNAGLGLKRTGAIFSYKNNRIVGNSPDGKASKYLPMR